MAKEGINIYVLIENVQRVCVCTQKVQKNMTWKSGQRSMLSESEIFA